MTNKIQKNSALAVVVAVASTLISSSAQAQTFFGDFSGFIKDANTLTILTGPDAGDYTAVRLDDGGSNELTFDNFNFLADPGSDFFGDGIRIRYDLILDEFIFEYASLPQSAKVNGTLSYDITGTVLPIPGGEFRTVVTAAEVDSVVNGISGAFDIDVNITTDVGGPYELFSDNGNSQSTSVIPNANILSVVNTLSDGGDTITGLANSYITTNDTQITDVPEPGTIIGILALGGLGLATKGKKQK